MGRSSLVARVALFLVCAPLLAGCQTLGGAGLITSSVTAELTPEAAAVIASNMVDRFAEQVGPGSTTIQLRADGSVFGQALEVSLREQGYAVAIDQDVEGASLIPLAYVIDSFEGSVMVRLSTPTLELTRMYQLGAAGAMPASPLSIMHRVSDTPS